jgi:hypothetical protein
MWRLTSRCYGEISNPTSAGGLPQILSSLGFLCTRVHSNRHSFCSLWCNFIFHRTHFIKRLQDALGQIQQVQKELKRRDQKPCYSTTNPSSPPTTGHAVPSYVTSTPPYKYRTIEPTDSTTPSTDGGTSQFQRQPQRDAPFHPNFTCTLGTPHNLGHDPSFDLYHPSNEQGNLLFSLGAFKLIHWTKVRYLWEWLPVTPGHRGSQGLDL